MPNTNSPDTAENPQPKTIRDRLENANQNTPASTQLDHPSQEAVLKCAQVRAAIQAEENQSLFYRDGVLIEIEGDRAVIVDTGHKLANWCLFNDVKFHTEKDGKGKPKRVNGRTLRIDYANLLVSRAGPWREYLYPVDSVTAVPFFRPDGSVITKRGYYPDLRLFNVADTGLILDDTFEVREVTQEHAAKALNWLNREIFGDFKFASPADRANAIAAPLALLTRYIHGDVLPLWAITARESGTGKGYCAQVVRTIITPDDSGTTGLPENEAELQKVIGSLLTEAQPVISWDNVERGSQITSATLCRLHTSAKMQTRTLGQSKIPVGLNDRLWIADGNNIRPGEDMVRRYVQVALDAETKDPALTGREFRHPNLIGFINENRSTVIGYYLMMYKAWLDAGSPPAKNAPVVSSYSKMIHVVAGVLEYAGMPHFWGNMAQVREEAISGSDEEANYNFLQWIYGNESIDASCFASADVVEAVLAAEPGAFSVSDMSTPLPEPIASKWHKGAGARSTAVTKYLKSVEEQRFGYHQMFRVVRNSTTTANKVHFTVVLEVVGDKEEVD